jgi:hypothetical protein
MIREVKSYSVVCDEAVDDAIFWGWSVRGDKHYCPEHGEGA